MESQIPWGPLRSLLYENFPFGTIKNIVGYTGIDMSRLSHLEQKANGGATKSELLSAIDAQIGELPEESAKKISIICCEEILRRKPQLENTLNEVLSRVGWVFRNSYLVPLSILDLQDIQDLPSEAHNDLFKAASRLRNGDLSGALSAACGAVDSVTTIIFRQYSLGDPGEASFQEKIKRSIDALNLSDDLKSELNEIGWGSNLIMPFEKNLIGSLNQAAYVLQTLRSNMGDVHGTKPVLLALAYDSIKWAELLLRILSKASST